MAKAFLYVEPHPPDEAYPPAATREKVRILVIGQPTAVNRVIDEMSHLGFSEPFEWSKPLPTERPDETMRVLTRYVLAIDKGFIDPSELPPD